MCVWASQSVSALTGLWRGLGCSARRRGLGRLVAWGGWCWKVALGMRALHYLLLTFGCALCLDVAREGLDGGVGVRLAKW